MIKITGLSKRYGRIVAVNEVTFTCMPGTVTGFLGPNGAGKITLRGLTRPDPARRRAGPIAAARVRGLPNPARVVGTLLGRVSRCHPADQATVTLRIARRP